MDLDLCLRQNGLDGGPRAAVDENRTHCGGTIPLRYFTFHMPADSTPPFRPRAIPRVGARVLVAYLAVQSPGTVVSVSDDLRELEVELDDGDRVAFRLVHATGTFRALDSSRARLRFA